MKVKTKEEGQFECGSWKTRRSNQYQNPYPIIPPRAENHAQVFPCHRPQTMNNPARNQTPPIMAVYSGPGSAWYSFKLDQNAIACTNRITFHKASPRMINASKVILVGLRFLDIFFSLGIRVTVEEQPPPWNANLYTDLPLYSH